MEIYKDIENKNFKILSKLIKNDDIGFEYFFYNEILIKVYFLHLYLYYFVSGKNLDKLKQYNLDLFNILEYYRNDVLEKMRYDNDPLKLVKDKFKQELLNIFDEVIEFVGNENLYKTEKVRNEFIKTNLFLAENLSKLIQLNVKK